MAYNRLVLDIVVLISGGGSILNALLTAIESGDLTDVRVVAVGSDTQAAGLDHALSRGIATFVTQPKDYPDRVAWGAALLEQIRRHGVGLPANPGLVISAGLMRILPPEFVASLAPNLINTHPALLPNFPGAHAVRDALAAGVAETGCTVHLIDQGVDTGKVLRQVSVAVNEGESEAELHERIKEAERPLLIGVVQDIADRKITL